MKKLLLQLFMLAKWVFYGVIIQCFSISMLLANEGAAQNIKSVKEYELNIDFEENSIFEVFQKIEEETGYHFVYDKSISKENLAYSKNFSRRSSVADVLMDISEKYNLRFRQINKSIIVAKKTDSSSESADLEVIMQSTTITGKVTSEDSPDGLPGVNVIVKGTSQGTVTDVSGNYTIDVQSTETILVFSSIGFITEEVVVGDRSVINLKLTPDITELQEIVVTGYTSQRKKDITGAVTVIDAEALNSIKAPSFAQKLAGRATGVTVSTSGQPGEGTNIRIRGISSFNAGSDPLIIIDGVQIQGDKALNGLNPNDIESMQVLKDASAASIYGARANAGVIIITTRQGTPGKIQVTYDGYVGVQTPVGGYNDFMIKDPRDYARIQMAKNPAMIPFYGGDPDNPVIPEYFYPTNDDLSPRTNIDESSYSFPDNLIMKSSQQGTDWWDELFDPAMITEHNIGISGGSENAVYSGSVGYMRQNGTMIHTYFERYSGRLNSRFTAGKFTFGESISFARSENVTQQGNNGNEQNTITQTILMNSIVPVYDIAGNFAGAKTTGFSNAKNPVAFAVYNQNDVDVDYRVLANVYGEYKILEDLKFKTSYSVDLRDLFQPRVNYPRFEDREVNSSNNYQETKQTYFNWTWTNTLEFSKTLADLHSIKVLLGTEAVRNQFKQINGQVNDLAFLDPTVRYLNLTYSSINTMGSQERISTIASLFGQINYGFNDKYLLTATIRRDGSSEFLEDNRYGVFPAASVGWRISSESFMEGLTMIDDLKLRAGWGVTGNQNIPRGYNAFDHWSARNTYDATYDIGGNNTSAVRGFTRYTYGNPDAKWEENESVNIGLDASLFNGRFMVVFDWYKRDISDLIFNPPFPGSAGNANASFRNVASMTNTGWDLGLDYNGNITSELGFNVALNLSHYVNEITKLDGQQTFIFPPGVDKRFGEINVWQVGYPISSFYGYTNDGFFDDDQEIDAADAADGDPTTEYQAGQDIGRFKRKDINGDGIINGDDQAVIGNPHPDLTAGLNIGLNYRNFDFSIFLFASIGNEIYNYNKLFSHFGQFNSNMSKDVLTETWTESNKENATLPELDGGDTFASQSSDFYVENGSYLRAQNISLGYTFPGSSLFAFRNLRIYVQAQNLFTITEYSGIDPALSNVDIGVAVDGRRQNDGWTGYDLGSYPSSKTFMFGVNATF